MSHRKKLSVKGITFAPFLKELNGHVKDYHTSLQNLFEINGWDSVTLLPLDSPLDNLGGKWKRALYNPPKWSRRSVIAKGMPLLVNLVPLVRLMRSLWRAIKSEMDPDNKTILFFETFNTFHLYALAFILPFLPIKNLSLWILYRYDSKQLFFKGKRDKRLLNLIEKILIKKRLRVFADTSALQEELSGFFKRKVELVPIPHTSGMQEREKKEGELTLWWPGVPRRPKGLHSIQKLTGYVAPENVPLTLRVSEKTQDLKEPSSFKIERVQENLSREDYLSTFDSSDIILMPYNAWNYRYSSSGIFIEAIFSKKLPIVSRGLWISDELKKYGLSCCILDYDDPHLLYQIVNLYQDPKVHEKIEKMSQAYRAYHTEQNFANLLSKYV